MCRHLLCVSVVAAVILSIAPGGARVHLPGTLHRVSDAPGASGLRIVGGSVATQSQFPHQVALLKANSLSCGGSLIASKWVLTAAHCVYNGNQLVPASSLTVLAGTVSLTQGGLRRNVAQIIPHERYGNFQNDIALLELAQALPTSDAIRPIALRTRAVAAGSEVIISGWGRIYHGGPISQILKYNRVQALSTQRCSASTGISSGLICLSSAANNGACNGDSGGPAILNNELIGVANFIINYCGSTNPDGYARVSDYVSWIRAKIN